MLENIKACFMYGRFLIRRRKKIKEVCMSRINEINNTFGMSYDSYINIKYYKKISRDLDKSHIYPDEFFANAIWLFGNYGDVLYNIDIGVHGKEISVKDMNKLMKNYHRFNESRELHRERNGYLQYQMYMNNYNLLELSVSLEVDASLLNKSPQLYYIDYYNDYEYLKGYNRGRLEYMLGLYPKKYGPYNNLYNIKSSFNGDKTRFYHDFKDIITKYEIYDMFEKIN